MVVAYHVTAQSRRGGYQGGQADWLASGVEIFFVISGCIMWVTTQGKSPSTVYFYRKRIIRIVPLYWVMTTIMVVGLLVRPSMFNSAKLDINHALGSYFFLPVHHPVLHGREPLVVQGWTLNYEMFFYLVFGVLLLVTSIRIRLALLVVIFGATVAANAVVSFPPILDYYSQPLILDFAAGALIGALYLRGYALPSPLAVFAICIGLLALALPGPYWPGGRVISWGVPAAAIVCGALSLEPRVRSVRWLKVLGDASYSIYISHGMVLSAFGAFWIHFIGFGRSGLLGVFLVSALAFAVLAGLCVYYAVERPMARLLRRGLPQPRPAARELASGRHRDDPSGQAVAGWTARR
jgi:exopolysaccharide production protein ExoZ